MMINQSALCKLITTGSTNIVNIREDGFQYCNGYMMSECSYEDSKILSKLIRVGAIRAGEKMRSDNSKDLTQVLQKHGEIPARQTKYMLQTDRYDKPIAVIFEANNHYYAYNKAFIDVFSGVTYTVIPDGDSAMLKAYQGEKLIGIVLNMRTEKKMAEEVRQINI
jgi:ABC-type transport system substrate-binding protein